MNQESNVKVFIRKSDHYRTYNLKNGEWTESQNHEPTFLGDTVFSIEVWARGKRIISKQTLKEYDLKQKLPKGIHLEINSLDRCLNLINLEEPILEKLGVIKIIKQQIFKIR